MTLSELKQLGDKLERPQVPGWEPDCRVSSPIFLDKSSKQSAPQNRLIAPL